MARAEAAGKYDALPKRHGAGSEQEGAESKEAQHRPGARLRHASTTQTSYKGLPSKTYHGCNKLELMATANRHPTHRETAEQFHSDADPKHTDMHQNTVQTRKCACKQTKPK